MNSVTKKFIVEFLNDINGWICIKSSKFMLVFVCNVKSKNLHVLKKICILFGPTFYLKKLRLILCIYFFNYNFNFVVVARCDFSNWIKIHFLRFADLENFAIFFWKNITSRHECLKKNWLSTADLTTKNWSNILWKNMESKKIVTLVYHLQTNEIIEKNHRSITDILTRLFDGKKRMKYSAAVSWANIFTVKNFIEINLYRLTFNQNFVFYWFRIFYFENLNEQTRL